MDGIKPGWQTSEFWATIIGLVMQLLVALGVLQSDDANSLGGLIVAALMGIIPLVVYIWSRVKVKTRQ